MSTDKQAVESPAADEPAGHAGDDPADHAAGDSADDAVAEPADDRADDGADASDAAPEGPGADERQPSWWHRDHPTFAALSGFFTGLLFVSLVPAAYVGVLSLLVSSDRVEELFPFVLVTLIVPLALVANQRTRRFGTYFWIGMILTAVVVLGVGALVLWFLVENQS